MPEQSQKQPLCPETRLIDSAIYWYELVKRPGWRNRRVESVTYLGDCRYEYKVSVDISDSELSDRCNNDTQQKQTHVLLDVMPKQELMYEFSAFNSQGDSINLVPRIVADMFTMNVLLGCIFKYARQKEVDNKPKFYPNLYPRKITLPSPRMIQILEEYVRGDYRFDSEEELFATLNNKFEKLKLGRTEKAAWKSLKEIYEFRYLMFRYTNNWLPVLVANPMGNPHDRLLKIRFTKVENLYDLNPKNDKYPIIGVCRFFLSFLTAAVFGYFLAERIISSSSYTGSTDSMVAVIAFILIGVLFWIFLSRDFVAGMIFFFGKRFSFPLDSIGTAETEHVTITAPEGMVFTPLRFFQRQVTKNFAIFDYVNGDIYQAHAEARGSLTTEHIAIRTNKGFSHYDPWANDTDSGHRYRRIPYSPNEHHHYSLEAWLRPKIGKRGLGYVLAPLITLVALYITEFWGSADTVSATSILLALAPLGSLALTTSEDEPFVRKAFLRFPRACWKLSIALAAISFFTYFIGGEAWSQYLLHSTITLVVLFLISFFWYVSHRWIDHWTRNEGAFEKFEVPIMPIDKTTGKLTK
jgi:hypothetical protein